MRDVARTTGLVRREGSGNWYFRQRWPKRFSAPNTPAEIWISLETAIHAEGRERLDEARQLALERFREGASVPLSGIRSMTIRLSRPRGEQFPHLLAAQAQGLAQKLFFEAMKEMDRDPWLAAHLSPDQANDRRMELTNRLVEAQGHCDEEGPDFIAGAETNVLSQAGLQADPDSEAGQLLREYLRRAIAQLAAIRLARFDGDFSDDISDALFRGDKTLTAPAYGGNLQGIVATTVKAAIDAYLGQEMQKGIRQKTKDRYRAELKHIVAFFGAETSMTLINRQECERFRDHFSLLPPNFEDKLRSGISLDAIVERRAATDPVLAWATHHKYLAQLSRFMKWANKRDYVAKDYAADIKPLGAKPDGSMAKLPFEAFELQRIFGRPLYTGCKNDRHGFATPGDRIIRRARYWAPLIALFSGLRCGEIMQLTPAHFGVSPNGHSFIVLTADMQLKTDNAMREVPVHSILEKIGLLEWVERRRAQPDGLLFPEVTPDKNYGQTSSIFSKRYSSDLNHFQLGERRKKLTFHSFRHTFKRGLDRADVPEAKKDELCGWTRGVKTGRRYGIGLEADVLKSSVEAVQYDADFSHLFHHAVLKD